MTILSMPPTPGFASSSFGLASNTQTFKSPLTGQAQSIERPGARWKATYTLPPMNRAQAAAWQAFLLQLRGGAGRFYAYDPDAKTPQGSALAQTISIRNELRNGSGAGLALGALGAGGALPLYWGNNISPGIMREVLGGGLGTIDIRFSGVSTTSSIVTNFETTTQIAASEGSVWTSSLYHQLLAGSLTNITSIGNRIEQLSATGVSQFITILAFGTVDGTLRRHTYTRTLSDTTPDTARVRSGLQLTVTPGQPIDITLRIGYAQLENSPSAQQYLQTWGLARSRDAGPRVNSSGQSGNALDTWNWVPNSAGVLKAGDYVAYDTAAGRSLHMLTADATSDSDTRAILALEPPIRTAPADNAALITTNPSCIMALIEDSVVWEADAAGTYRLRFSAEERF